MRDKREEHITRMIQVCLDIANTADEKKDVISFYEDLHLGCHALSGIIRRGVKAVIDLQGDYYMTIASRDYARREREEAKEFLEDVFGDRDITMIGDDHKRKLKEFVKRMDEDVETDE